MYRCRGGSAHKLGHLSGMLLDLKEENYNQFALMAVTPQRWLSLNLFTFPRGQD